MCTKDVTDIHMPRNDNKNRFVGPPIIEWSFINILDLHIIIGGKNIQKKREINIM